MNRREIDALAFVMLAVREYAAEQHRQGKYVPEGLRDVLGDLVMKRESGHNGSVPGHSGSSVDRGSGRDQADGVKPQLVSYSTAAEVLGCSVSTIKRRVMDGHLEPVRRDGHRPRLRLSDLERYVEGAA